MHPVSLPTAATAAALLAAAACLSACASDASVGVAGPEADRRFYESRCGLCHVPFHRSDFRPSDWPSIVEHFGPRAGLSTAQRARVVAYLTAPESAPAAR